MSNSEEIIDIAFRGNGVYIVKAERKWTSIISAALAGFAILAAAAGALWYYNGTATVSLENRSDGHSVFYIDGVQACDAPARIRCLARLSSWKIHTLTAVTDYCGHTYPTPEVSLYPQRNAEYVYVSCGMTGTPRQDCGFFSVRATPPAY
jgi:hypothetical protein